MRRTAVAGLSGLAAAGWLGCGSARQPVVPADCVADPGAIASALTQAPRPVTLPGGTPLSSCARDASGAADLQNLGVVMVAVAEDLGSRVPGSDRAALELGYLVGTMRRGMAGDNGVHAELERRLEQAMPEGVAASRRAAYERGLRAGAGAG